MSMHAKSVGLVQGTQPISTVAECTYQTVVDSLLLSTTQAGSKLHRCDPVMPAPLAVAVSRQAVAPGDTR